MTGGIGGISGVQDTWQNSLLPHALSRVPKAQDEPVPGVGIPAIEDDGKKADGRFDGFPQKKECQTCKERKYQDGSDDSGVSYKSPTAISANEAAGAVAGHEREHVFREQAKAKMEGRKVVSQTVTIHSSICPECGTSYVSGGTTRTTTEGAETGQSGGADTSDGKSGLGRKA